MSTTTHTYDAVFEHGVFRVLTPLQVNLPDGQPVRISVEPVESPQDVLELATRVYEGFSDSDIEELEEMILDRNNFFKDRETR